MIKRSATLMLSVAALAVMPPLVAQRPAAPSPAPASLVGTWTLTSIEQRFKGGEPTRVANPRGLMVYDSAGHALEIVTHAGRPQYAANQPTPAEAHATFDNYSGFWGGYRVDDRAGQIVYHPLGAVHPNVMGQDLPRSYELKGDTLTITALASEPNARAGSKWTWERVPPVDNLSPTYRKVVGFWQHVVEKRVNLTTGAQVSENERAPSIIVYTPSGFVGVHFPPLNRKKFAGDVPTDDEARAAIQGYVGYYGALTVYPGMVFHHRLALLGPTQGDTLKRFFEIVGSEVHLKFPPNVNQQGQETTTLVTLKRLSGDAEMLGTAAR
jgi:hypothetical protein